jgi:hypothetical protein
MGLPVDAPAQQATGRAKKNNKKKKNVKFSFTYVLVYLGICAIY